MTDTVRQALNRLRAFFSRQPLEQDLDSEMASHLEFAIEENLRRGLGPEEARRQALVRFGGLEQAREQHREARGLPMLDVLMQDLRYGIRSLRRDRSFATVTVLILTLGIAANIAVFSVVNTLLLRPLPFTDAQQLVWFTGGRQSKTVKQDLSAVTYTVAAFQAFQRHNRSFQEVTSYDPFFGDCEFTLTGRSEPQAVAGVRVAENFFTMLGVRPVLGRAFTREESQKGGRPAVVLSYPFWQRHFAGDPNIVGQAVTLSKQSVTVVGVMPSTFDFGSVFSPGTKIDVLVPAIMDDLRDWGNTLAVIGRLKPGVTLIQAQSEGDVLWPQLHATYKWPWGDYTSTLTGLHEFITGKLHRSLMVLWSAVGLILLIVCVNLSNLMLARTAARSKEFALRSALGAARGRLFRQLLTESLMLASSGAVLGLGLAVVITRYLAHQGSIALPLLGSVSVDGTALAWTLLITLAAAVLFGFATGLKVSGGNIQDALKDTGHGLSSGRKHDRLRAVLVVSEVALACVLLVGAGLLLRSFLRVLDVDLGFRPSQAAVIKVDYDDGGKRERRGAILEEMLRNVAAIPGVESAGIADMLPLGRNRSWGFAAKGHQYQKDEVLGALVRIVTPGYLAAMGMHLEGGRDFSWRDREKSEPVMIINRAAARRFWQGEDALGRLGRVNGGDARVVGILADVREHSLEASADPEMYLPASQAEPEGAELVVRTRLPPDTLGATVIKTLRALNPAQPAAEFRPLRQIVDRAVSPRRFFVLLVASFAMLGLILATLGIYGVISYSVVRRTQEIGIRMALGATAGQVQSGVIAKALRLALVGIAVGTIGSLAAARWIASLLFGTTPTDPATFAGIVVLLAAVAVAAGYIPARRASRIDPMIALRSA